MVRKQLTTRVDENLLEDFEDFVDETGTSKSEALRILLRDGLDAQEESQLAEEIRELRERVPRTDGGKVASKANVRQLRAEQGRHRRANMWQNLGLGSGVMYLAGLTFFDVPTSVVVIFGALISTVILYSVYRMSEFISIENGDIDSANPNGGDQ